MYGNEGEKWVQLKEFKLDNLILNEVGKEFEIQDYYSVPHGYASIKYKGMLLFIPDGIFKQYFIKANEFKNYLKDGDEVNVNVHGDLYTYTIQSMAGNDSSLVINLKGALKREF